MVAPSIHAPARAALLQLQYTTGRETIFAGVNRVLPGELLVVRNGRIVERAMRAALPDAPPAAWSEEEAMRRIEAALTDSVRVHQRSDVPYGMFLSGGVDSSTLIALMAELNDRPVCAFTAGFDGTAAPDERVRARAIAQSLNAESVDVSIGEADFWSDLPRIAAGDGRSRGGLRDPTHLQIGPGGT